MAACTLTTFDNPYDPFEQFRKWFLYDIGKGYNTCGKLARVAKTSDAFTDEENERQIEIAVDAIIKNDFLNIYTKKYYIPQVKNKTAPV